jgi:hypothetical protein
MKGNYTVEQEASNREKPKDGRQSAGVKHDELAKGGEAKEGGRRKK